MTKTEALFMTKTFKSKIMPFIRLFLAVVNLSIRNYTTVNCLGKTKNVYTMPYKT